MTAQEIAVRIAEIYREEISTSVGFEGDGFAYTVTEGWEAAQQRVADFIRMEVLG